MDKIWVTGNGEMLVVTYGEDSAVQREYFPREAIERELAKDTDFQTACKDWDLTSEEMPSAYLHWQRTPGWNPGSLADRQAAREQLRQGMRQYIQQKQGGRDNMPK